MIGLYSVLKQFIAILKWELVVVHYYSQKRLTVVIFTSRGSIATVDRQEHLRARASCCEMSSGRRPNTVVIHHFLEYNCTP